MALHPDALEGPTARRGLWAGMDQASVMGMEMLAGILTWSLLGWLADRWLGTTPWLFGIGAMLGFAGGLYLVFLRSKRMDAREAAHELPHELPHERSDGEVSRG
jgi:ATP synthase protein I